MSFFTKSAIGAVTLLALTACGGAETPPATEASPAPTEPVVTAESAPETPTPPPQAPAKEPNEAFANLPAPYTTADFNVGKRVFKQCSSCHMLKEGAPALVGPNLHGMFGRAAGGIDGFKYSKALEEADFVWTPEKLDEWLTNPRGFLPGNNMSFTGVRKEDQRQAVIAYIMAEGGYQAPAE